MSAIRQEKARVLYDPSPVQARFHALTTDEALFGGSAGPGKSAALRADLVQCGLLIQEHERWRRKEITQSRAVVANFRRTMPMHEESFARAKELYWALDPGFKVVDQKSRYVGTFSCGLKVIWGHLKDSDAFEDHKSSEYVRINWDETSQFEAEQYDQMQTRIRTSDEHLTKFLASRGASNPAPGWLRDYFVTPAPEGRTVLKKLVTLSDGTEVAKTRIFIPALLRDHPSAAFRAQYEAQLRGRPPHIRAALLNGDWYVIAGAFFSEVWDPDLVIVKPFTIPRHWPRFRSMDWGLKSECPVLWWTVDPEGNLICYRERTFNGKAAKGRYLDAAQVALKIRDIEMAAGEWNTSKDCSRLTGPADTQLWSDIGQKGGRTMAQDMAEVGVYWTKSSKGRVQNAQQVFKRLGARPVPALRFFETCQGCITTIPALGTDENEPEAPKEGGPDHHYDAVQYACAYRTTAASDLPGNDNRRGWADDDDDDDEDARASWGRMGYGR